MSIRFDILDDIRVASPCPADWSKMAGDDRVRHCNACNLNVYDLSEMTREEATRLVFETEGRVCARFYRRNDGTVVTNDCPRGIAVLRKRLRRWSTAVASFLGISLSGSVSCANKKEMWLKQGLIDPDCHAQSKQSRSNRNDATQTSQPAKISEFQGEHRFLSNFWPETVIFEGITYPTAEHAYQSAKTLDMAERRRIAELTAPSDAKREGRALALRADWEQVKFDVMEAVVRDKFTRNADLREKLLATGDATLEEGNTWGDRVWGVYEGQGENRLGMILMKVRDELQSH